MCLFLPGIRSSDLIGLLEVREWMGVVYSVSTQMVIKILEFCD